MAIIKNLKEIMQAVSILCLSLLISFSSFSQPIAEGEYHYRSVGGDRAIVFTILDHQKFFLAEYGDITTTKSGGYYFVDTTQLILFKEPLDEKQLSTYSLKSSEWGDSTKLALIEIAIFEDSLTKLPFNNAWVSLRQDNLPGPTFITNQSGKANLMLNRLENTSIRIHSFGYEWLDIPLDSFQGKIVEVQAILYPQSIIYEENTKEYFEIIKITSKTLKLKNQEGQIFNFKKID